MTPAVARAVRRFARAADLRAGTGRFLAAGAVLACAATIALLLARVFGVPCPPRAAWCWLLALPLAWAIAATRRARTRPDAAAAHLDRRLGLDGLLLSAAALGDDAMDGAQKARLGAALRGASAAMPRLRWRRVLPWPLATALAFAIVAVLPAPANPTPRVPAAALQLAVAKLAERIEQLPTRSDDPTAAAEQQELRERAAALRQQLERGAVPAWSELDRLEARIDRSALAAAARADAAERARAAGGAAAALAAVGKALADAGTLAQALAALPEALRAAAQQALAAGGSPGAAGLDEATLRQLAELLAQGAGAGASPGADGAAGEAGRAGREALAAMLRQRNEHRHGPECAGGT